MSGKVKSWILNSRKKLIWAVCVISGAAVCINVLSFASRNSNIFDPSRFANNKTNNSYDVQYNKVTFDASQSGDNGLSVDEKAKEESSVESGKDETLVDEKKQEEQNKNNKKEPLLIVEGENASVSDENSQGGSDNNSVTKPGEGINASNDENGATVIIPSGGGNGNGASEGDGTGNGENTVIDTDGGVSKNPVHTEGTAPYEPGGEVVEPVKPSYDEDKYQGSTIRIVNVTGSLEQYFYPGETPTAEEMSSYISVSTVVSGNGTSDTIDNLKYAYKNDFDTYGGDYTVDWNADTSTAESSVSTTPGTYRATVYFRGVACRRTLEYHVADWQVQLMDFDESFESLNSDKLEQIVHASGSARVDLYEAQQNMNSQILKRTQSGKEYNHVYKLNTSQDGYEEYFGGWSKTQGSSSVGRYFTMTRPSEDDIHYDDNGIAYYRTVLYPVWIVDKEDNPLFIVKLTGNDEDGYDLTLTGYRGKHSSLKVLNVPDGVTKVDFSSLCSSDEDVFTSLNTVSLPSTVSTIIIGMNNSISYPVLENFAVADDNSCYVDVDGILYDKTGQTLVMVPGARDSVSIWSKYVRKLGDYAFVGTGIQVLEVPETVDEIGEYCFSKASLKKVTLLCKTGVDFGKGCFANEEDHDSASAKELIISDSENNDLYIEDLCSLIKSFMDLEYKDPSQVSYLLLNTTEGAKVNYSCNMGWILSSDRTEAIRATEQLESECSLPDGVTTVKTNALNGFDNIVSVTLPMGVTALETGCFSGAESLCDVYFMDPLAPSISMDGRPFGSAISVGIKVFVPENAYSSYLNKWSRFMTRGYGPGTAERIILENDDSLIREDGSLYKEVLPGEYSILRAPGDAEGSFTLKDGTDSIGDYAFANRVNIEEIRNTEDLKSVGKHAFDGCSSLKALFPMEAVTSIGEYAFNECSEISGELMLPEKLDTIGDYAFNNCSKLTGEIVIPDGVSTIGSYAFNGCSQVSGDLLLGENVTQIYASAFRYTGITSLIIKCNLSMDIGYYAFSDCSELESLTVDGSLSGTGGYAFSNCIKLKNVTINGSVENIGDFAFYECTDLSTFIWGNVKAANSLVSIGRCAFYDTALTGLPLNRGMPSANVYVNDETIAEFSGCVIFEGMDRSRNRLFTSLKSVGDAAFAYCRNLKYMSMPAGLSYDGYDSWDTLIAQKWSSWFMLSGADVTAGKVTPFGSAETAINNYQGDEGSGDDSEGGEII